jgi:hypothetical protein
MTTELTQRIERIGLSYERADMAAADRYWATKAVCPWCDCESADEDVCDQCGEYMDGEGYWACVYCGSPVPPGNEPSTYQCCGECHAEYREPKK